MIFAAWCACCAMSVAAQDCEISLIIAKAAQKEELPSQVQEILGNRLAAAVAGQGSVLPIPILHHSLSQLRPILYIRKHCPVLLSVQRLLFN